jgi:ATP-dependent RNA helicase DeaD
MGEIFMLSEFEVLGLEPRLIEAVEQMGYTQPTPIQLAAIPALLAGRNVLGQAQTGTGKTAAFALPMLQMIEPGKGYVQALVLAPTRELAVQVAEATGQMAQNTSIRVLAVYGGQAYSLQTRQLKRGVEVVVGTPGRLLDLIRKGFLDLSHVRSLVLDEADEMLEMGFIEDVETILAQVTGERQVALFSATLPAPIRKLADRYLSDPHLITINPTHLTVAETEQRFCRVREENKLEAFTRLLEVEDVTSALIFTRTKARAQEICDALIRRGHPAEALHGDLSQDRREAVLNRFRQHTATLLVATDVAARGLDIENVSHVINFDAPGDPEDYVHRIGRTGRAGRKGISITFLTPRERKMLGQIESYTHQTVTECHIPTPQMIQARRNERFVQRVYEQLVTGEMENEQAVIAGLVESGLELSDIAAAAIRLARLSEGALPTEKISEPLAESGSAHSYGRRHSEGESERGVKKSPYRSKREWQSDSSPRAFHGKHDQETGMVRLRMNLGGAHGIRPSDIVGAIASEVGIPGRAIGQIDIRPDYSLVDVSEKHVRDVLRASSGKYNLRGKPVTLKLAQ